MGRMISIADLYARDNGICGICKKHIKKISQANRDHIIPASRGGGNAQSNLRIAHITCNIRRGNDGPTMTMQDLMRKVGETTGWTCALCSDNVEADWSKTSLTNRQTAVAHRTCLERHYRSLAK